MPARQAWLFTFIQHGRRRMEFHDSIAAHTYDPQHHLAMSIGISSDHNLKSLTRHSYVGSVNCKFIAHDLRSYHLMKRSRQAFLPEWPKSLAYVTPCTAAKHTS